MPLCSVLPLQLYVAALFRSVSAQPTTGFWGHAEWKCRNRYRVKDKDQIKRGSQTGLKDIPFRFLSGTRAPKPYSSPQATHPLAPETYALISLELAPTSSLLSENCSLTR